MTLIDRPDPRTFPPLQAGQRLDRTTFHERYEAMPPGTRAELVGGVVFMPSPLKEDHGEVDNDLSCWLGHYKRSVPGLRSPSNATVKLGEFGEPQPDVLLRIREEFGGQSRVVDGYIVGAPELVIEVSGSSLDDDLGPKFRDYDRAGVLEYVVADLKGKAVSWFGRRGGRLVLLDPEPDGILRSEVFPGLWLDPWALFEGDLDRLIAVLDRGIDTPGRRAFAARLAGAEG